MVNQYMIPVYALLIRSGKYALEEGSGALLIPERYRLPVAEYLASQEPETTI